VADPGDAQLFAGRRRIRDVRLCFGKRRRTRPGRKRIAEPLPSPAQKLFEAADTVAGRPWVAEPAALYVMLVQKNARVLVDTEPDNMNKANAGPVPPVAERTVFLAGGTGFIGQALARTLLEEGVPVRALTRAASAKRLPVGCSPVIGDALDHNTFVDAVRGAHSYVHLIGAHHPSPAKAKQFIDIDLRSIEEAVAAAKSAGVKHFVYLSIAQPAPIMKAYIDVRVRGEEMVRASGIPATIVRPWYVLGPGRRWPLLFVPGYWLLELIPSTRETARRLALVTLEQMVRAIAEALRTPSSGWRVIDVQQMRAAR
jgi:uncharacterized protein YbjT (DUF2867 family)